MGSEVDPRWRKASYSGSNGGSCVEVGDGSSVVLIRDTKQEHRTGRTTLAVGSAAWSRFISAVKQ
jgi:hypothetical protein